MGKINKISTHVRTGLKMFSTVSMIGLLVFLTSVNYFLYSVPEKNITTVAYKNAGDTGAQPGLPNSPAGPDEKSPDVPVSASEEYVHDNAFPEHSLLTNTSYSYSIHRADKLRIVHFELLSPPPEV